jgi:predicted anti-sigma-YlaC factor YlaD
MNCKEARALFSEFYDEELNQEISEVVKEHLAECAECKLEYRNFKKGLKILKKLKVLEAPRNYVHLTQKH